MADSLAGAVVEVGADLGPLTSLLAQAPSSLTGPLGQLGDAIAANMARAISQGAARQGAGGNAGEEAAKAQSKGFVREWLGAVPLVGGALEQVYGLFAGVTTRIVSPVTQGVGLAKDVLVGGLGLAAGLAGDLVNLNLGRAMARVSNFVFGTLSNTVTRAFTVVFGERLGGVLSSVITGPLDLLGGVVTSWAGRIGGAIINPIKAALGAGLGNLDFWVGKSIAFEYQMAKFGATLGSAGRQVGFTEAQLVNLAAAMAKVSVFSRGEILEGMERAFTFSTVRGEQFTRMMELAVNMAPRFGGLESAVQMLGLAMQNPEHGAERVARRLGIVHEEMQRIKDMAKSGLAIEEVQKAFLGLLEASSRGVGETLLATTQGQLQKLSAEWKGIGRQLGDVFLPLVSLATYAARAVVGAFGGGVVPIFKQLKELTTSWANSVRSFLDENAPTFRVWAEQLRGIAQNVFDGIKLLFRNIFTFDTAGLAGFWGSFKSGVTDALAFVEALTSSWSDMWNIMKLAGILAWETVKDYAVRAFASIISGDAWKSFKDGFISVLTTIGEWLGALFTKVMDLAGAKARLLIAQMQFDLRAPARRLQENPPEQKALDEAVFQEWLARQKGLPKLEDFQKGGGPEVGPPAPPENKDLKDAAQALKDAAAALNLNQRIEAAAQRTLPLARTPWGLFNEAMARRGQAELNKPAEVAAGKFVGAEALYKQIQEGLTKMAGADPARDTAKNTKVTADELMKIGNAVAGPFVKAAQNLANLVPLG